MRTFIMLLLLASGALAQGQYIYSAGKVAECAPRDLPAVGVRLDDGRPVLGLHGAGDAVKQACGWYRVLPSQEKAAEGMRIIGRSYVLGKGGFQEVLKLTNSVVRVLTPEARIARVFDTMTGTEDERCTAIIKAVAQTITNKLSTAVTVTIPASKAEGGRTK